MSDYPDRPFQLGLLNDAIADAIGDKVAIAQGDKHLTYKELGERTRQLAHFMVGRGVGCHGDHATAKPWESVQDHVGICMLNRPEFAEAMIGAFKARAVPFNVNYRYTPSEVRQVLEDADTKVLIYESRFASLIAESIEGLEGIDLLIQVEDDSGSELLPGAVEYEAALEGQPTTRLDLPYDGQDIYIIYTGGTTGMPKGVMWPQDPLYLLTLTGQLPGEERPKTIAETVETAKNGFLVSMVCAPLMHGAGQWGTLNTLHVGGKVVYSPKPESLDAHAIWEACEREGVLTLQITGDAFAIPLVEAYKTGKYNVTLLAISSTAVALTDKVRADLHELFPDALIVESYGSTEGGLQAFRQGGKDDDTADTSTFQAANQSVIISEDRTRFIEPSEVGEIGWLGRTGSLPRGYYNDRAKTEATFVQIGDERYLVSGDRGAYREDGTIHFLGREAVCINSGGEKVFAEEVEASLKTHPKVVDALVVGIPDERFGERVSAVISTNGEVSDGDLDSHARQTIAGYKVPRTVVRTSEIPRLANGKPDYETAKQLVLKEEGQ
jgi:3-oxocholest-4-en-26-oate---CoA ligase